MPAYTVTNSANGPTLFASDNLIEATYWAQGHADNGRDTNAHYVILTWGGAKHGSRVHVYTATTRNAHQTPTTYRAAGTLDTPDITGNELTLAVNMFDAWRIVGVPTVITSSEAHGLATKYGVQYGDITDHSTAVLTMALARYIVCSGTETGV